MCRSKHVEPSINFGIINSVTKLHIVGISTESSTMHGSMNIKFMAGICFSLVHDISAVSVLNFLQDITCITVPK